MSAPRTSLSDLYRFVGMVCAPLHRLWCASDTYCHDIRRIYIYIPGLNILHVDRMDMFISNLDVLGGGAVVQSDADDTTIANIVTSVATAKIQMTQDTMETNRTMFEPYFTDMNILHQRHCFIDGPLCHEAMDAFVTVNNLLNIASFRLSATRDLVAHGLDWDLIDVLYETLRVHHVLHQAETTNRDILHLFHRVAGANRALCRNTLGSQLLSNIWRW